MNLASSVIVRNEVDRYLKPCIEHLLAFSDAVYVFDDASTDGTSEWLATHPDERLKVLRNDGAERDTGSDFHRHAENRNRLLQFTLDGNPTYILAIDADEFVSDGQALRQSCERHNGQALSLTMREVWAADENGLSIREDNLWRSHEVTMLWPTNFVGRSQMEIDDLGPATGRTPKLLNRMRGVATGESTYHFGWANPLLRQGRFDRYMEHDKGQYHQRRHLESIMWPDRRVVKSFRAWPETLSSVKPEILERANAVPSAS
jgi:glycosyltransferase involved in cell wall biosynthesis